MDIQIDLSGRIETLNADSALALSNRVERTILIPARVKRHASQQLAARGVKPKMISVRMFAGAVFLLVKPLLGEVRIVVIDREFEGRENEIRSLLLALIRKAGYKLSGEAVQFRSVGQQARCQHLALATFRRQRKPDQKVALTELLRVC
mgnify:CR=1 FL=1